MTDIIRLRSSYGVGRCMVCGAPCTAGWSHFEPDEGVCNECAFRIVRDMLDQPESVTRPDDGGTRDA